MTSPYPYPYSPNRDWGDPRAPGGRVPVGTGILSQVVGRHTPIPDPYSAADRAALIKTLTEALAENDKRIEAARKLPFDTYMSAISAAANLGNAMAEVEMAAAQHSQANAARLGVLRDVETAMAPVALAWGDAKTLTELGKDIRTNATAAMSAEALGGASLRSTIEQASHGRGGLYVGAEPNTEVLTALDNAMDNTFGNSLRKTALDKINALSGPSQGDTALSYLQDYSGAIGDLTYRLALNAGLSDADAKAYAQHYVDGEWAIMAEALPANTFTEAGARRASTVQAFDNVFDAALQKSGVDKSTREYLRGMGDDMRAIVRGGPAAMSAYLQQLYVPEELLQTRDIIMRRLTAAETPWRDPLDAAVADLAAVTPGFETWAQAMRFNSTERAAIYAARHPHELRWWIEQTRENPSLIAPENESRVPQARELISTQGKVEGWGFYVRGLGRLLRLPRHGYTAEEQAAELKRRDEAAMEGQDLLAQRKADAEQRAATAPALPPKAAPTAAPAGPTVPAANLAGLPEAGAPTPPLSGVMEEQRAAPYLATPSEAAQASGTTAALAAVQRAAMTEPVRAMQDGTLVKAMPDGSLKIMYSPTSKGMEGRSISPNDASYASYAMEFGTPAKPAAPAPAPAAPPEEAPAPPAKTEPAVPTTTPAPAPPRASSPVRPAQTPQSKGEDELRENVGSGWSDFLRSARTS